MRAVRLFAAAALSLGLSVLATSARAADANPQFAGWSKFGVGSSVTMAAETNAGGQKIASTIKTTLLEKGKDSVTVEMSVAMNVGGQSIAGQPVKQVIPAAGAAAAATGGNAAGVKQGGEETLTINGKAVKCKVVEVEAEAAGQKSVSKIWYADDIPGGVAKTVAKAPTGEVTQTVTAFEAK